MYIYATSRSTFATFRQNTCNIHLKQMKHLGHALETYATSRSTFATLIYNTCNIPRKHLKHFKHTIATCVFSVASGCCLDDEGSSTLARSSKPQSGAEVVGVELVSDTYLDRGRDRPAMGVASPEASQRAPSTSGLPHAAHAGDAGAGSVRTEHMDIWPLQLEIKPPVRLLYVFWVWILLQQVFHLERTYTADMHGVSSSSSMDHYYCLSNT
jgi:hypothetical protein